MAHYSSPARSLYLQQISEGIKNFIPYKEKFFYLIELGITGINVTTDNKNKNILTVKVSIDKKETIYNVIKKGELDHHLILQSGHILREGTDLKELVNNIERCYKDEISSKEESLRNNARLSNNDPNAIKQNLAQQLLDIARAGTNNAQILKKNGNDISIVVREGDSKKYYLINTDSDDQYFGAGNATGTIYSFEDFIAGEINLEDLKQSVKVCGGNVIEENNETQDYQSKYARRSASPMRSTEELIKIEKCFVEADVENKFPIIASGTGLPDFLLSLKNLLEGKEVVINEHLTQTMGIDYKALKILIPDPQERATKILNKKQYLIGVCLIKAEKFAERSLYGSEEFTRIKKTQENFEEVININAKIVDSKTRKM